jgi:putative endonuclease
MKWIVYILKCADGSLYTGITTDLEKRLKKHEGGTGAKYTKGRGPYKIVFSEIHSDKSSASKRESSIKNLTRPAKLEMIRQASRADLPA